LKGRIFNLASDEPPGKGIKP